MARVLVTGAAGFIGYHLCRRLLERGDEVTGIDNLNDYYDVELKRARAEDLKPSGRFQLEKIDISTPGAVRECFDRAKPEYVVNLAAQAGVRHSLLYPQSFVDSNVTGFLNILEGCRHTGVRHLVYASSSSVYGANTRLPWSPHDNVDHPLSLYAVTKKTNELMAHSYSFLFQLPTTGLRFFNVYGPWGRPDSVIYIFTRAILEGAPINVYNSGEMVRDFTYVDDVTEGMLRLLEMPTQPNPQWDAEHPDPPTSSAPYRVYNIGNHRPVDLNHLIAVLEDCLGRKAVRIDMPAQKGDIVNSFADVDDLMRDTGFHPDTAVEVGVARFVDWYRRYHMNL